MLPNGAGCTARDEAGYIRKGVQTAGCSGPSQTAGFGCRQQVKCIGITEVVSTLPCISAVALGTAVSGRSSSLRSACWAPLQQALLQQTHLMLIPGRWSGT